MTRKEHEALQAAINKISEYMEEANEAFDRLQELNGTEGTGHRWCCAQQNALDLLSVGKDKMYLYDKYTKAVAKQDALREIGSVLADLGFWK